jgi:hypothetical protein
MREISGRLGVPLTILISFVAVYLPHGFMLTGKTVAFNLPFAADSQVRVGLCICGSLRFCLHRGAESGSFFALMGTDRGPCGLDYG